MEYINEVKRALQALAPDAPEAAVEAIFSKPLLNALGFGDMEIAPGFKANNRPSRIADHAARKNVDDGDIFAHTRVNPFLCMEVKGRTETFAKGHKIYTKAAAQLKGYLLGSESRTAKWGILTNSIDIQLFRRHGKVVHPMTPLMPFDDVEKFIGTLKETIHSPKRALVAAIYNNKGGVGKTTTTINLAATLRVLGKKVLIIDFDPNQSDLGDSLNMPPIYGQMLGVLKGADIREVIKPYVFQHPKLKQPIGFDVVLADEEMVTTTNEVELRQQLRWNALQKAIKAVKNDYDYILIDAPPNWRIFSQLALFAADVVLIPARHDNLHSLQNAGTVITQYIPEIQAERGRYGEAGPMALPIFMNNANREAPAQIRLMHEAIAAIIKKGKANGYNLTPFFYPKKTPGKQNLQMIAIPHMAYVSKADFLHVPAAFNYKNVRDQYKLLIKEYFV
ncbi:MAG: AAA family ATPase [Cyanobacteria bacterium P01_F01_bin.150]